MTTFDYISREINEHYYAIYRLEQARTLIQDLKQPEVDAQALILNEVSAKHNIPIETMRGKSRKMETVRARHEAMKRLRDELHLSLKSIGEILGGRDHSTIHYALKVRV